MIWGKYKKPKNNPIVGQTFLELFLLIDHLNLKKTVCQVRKIFREKFNQIQNEGTFLFFFFILLCRSEFWISIIGRFGDKSQILILFVKSEYIFSLLLSLETYNEKIR